MKQKSEKLTWKKIGKGQKAFIIINAILVVGILSMYGYRLLYFMNEFEQNRNKSLEANTLSQVLISKVTLTTVDNGLCAMDDGSYLFKGQVSNNYVLYNGYLYRMIGIDTEGNIRIVSNSSLFNFYMASYTSFATSAINEYLNPTENLHSGLFKNNCLTDTSYLFTSSVCIDKVKELASIGCSLQYTSSDVGLLSLSDYKNAGASSSFLNNGENYWLINVDGNGNFWYVDQEGNLSISQEGSNLFGVRPVLTVSYSVKAKEGNGTSATPYVISDRTIETINDAFVGSYVSYSGSTWKVSLIQEDGVVALMDGTLSTDYAYGTTATFTTKSGVGKYLNTTYLKTLKNYTAYLVNKTWYSGKLKVLNVYDYRDNYDYEQTCYVSLPNTTYPYFEEYENVFVTTQPYESNKIIYTTTSSGVLYSVTLTQKKLLRPVICFNKNIKIVSGDGTKDNPYVLEEIK